MKSLIVLVIVLGLLLTACGTATPTESDTQIATRVSQILTNMPTATKSSAPVITTTPVPTLAGQATLTKAPATAAPAASATPQAATATAQKPTATQVPPTQTATLAPSKTPTTPVTPSATLPAGDPRSTLGKPTWQDAMDNGKNWPTGEDPTGYTAIDFKNGQLLLTSLKPVDGWRLTIPSAVNFYVEMTVKTDKCVIGDRWGMIVRVPEISTANQGYLFGINCDGAFALRRWDGTTLPKGTMNTLLDWKVNKAITAGAGKINRLGLMAKGSKLSVYANGILLGEVVDAVYTADGNFGVFSGAHGSPSLTIAVEEILFWELP